MGKDHPIQKQNQGQINRVPLQFELRSQENQKAVNF